ncbi:elongation factor G [Thermotoga sp. Ku-13t]|uniref:elongation factor G n=1 Tax=Thermotoga sp. Ku-13t TaxID=1755813 RepID=UPI0013EC2E89|nr:elongation factor G [Thermotoga sp. Ku-13t]KAF2958771.1 elongation factor G [Thermotoga sp. Ku-13t]
MAIATEKKRNFVLVGHNGSGKSLLVSSILKTAGLVDRISTKFVDTDPIEESKGSSINSHVFTFTWKDHLLTVIDTPGFGDFIADVINSIFVSENVVSVINAVAGVEIQTERTWQLAQEMSRPILVFVNQMDKERANFENALESVKSAFECKVVPLVLPIGAESDFKGLVDLVGMKAYVYEDGKAKPVSIPSELQKKVEETRLKLLEDIVESDDALMEKYLEGQEVDEAELRNALVKAYKSGAVVPALCGSAEKGIGIDLLLDTIVELGANPKEAQPLRAVLESGEEIEISPSETEPFCAYIFKNVADPFVGRVSYIKVIAGTVRPGDNFVNVNRGTSDRISKLYFARGKEQVEVEEASCGEIVVLPKLREGSVGETLTHKDRKLKIVPPQFPEPMFSRSVNPKSKTDIDKINNGLARLAESDPTFKWEYDPETGETVVSGLGTIHLDVMIEKLKSIFGVEVDVGKPKIAYRETITRKAIAEYKHKKQTGGHGQYGHVKIELEPLPRGAGFEFVDKIFGGAIPKNFIPSVEKGVIEAMKRGSLAGYPVVDVRVTLFDGSYHEVDSSDIAFQIAAIQAFRKGMEEARPVILEPIMEVEIFCPDEVAGDVMGEVTSRRGRPQGMEPAGRGMSKIKAEVPLAEMLDFSGRLSGITSGRGYFTMKFLRYQEVPPNIQEKIIQERKQEQQNA